MSASPLLVAAVSIAMSVAAQFLLKAGMTRVKAQVDPGLPSILAAAIQNPHVIAGFVLYGIGAVVWLAVLARLDVSKAYPLVGAGFVLTALVGYLIGEQVGATRLAGIALICCGVVLVGRS